MSHTTADAPAARSRWQHQLGVVLAAIMTISALSMSAAEAHNTSQSYSYSWTEGSHVGCASPLLRHPALSGSGFDYNIYGQRQSGGCPSGSAVTQTCSAASYCPFLSNLYRTNINGTTLIAGFVAQRTSSFSSGIGYGANYAGSDVHNNAYSWYTEGKWADPDILLYATAIAVATYPNHTAI